MRLIDALLHYVSGGVGLFGTLLADKKARPIAEALVNKVNSILEARDAEEARQLEHIRSGGGTCTDVSMRTDGSVMYCVFCIF